MNAWKTALWQQFGASIDMLENALNACPDHVWEDARPGRPFWYWAYHGLFFLDYYLADTDQGFTPPPPFGLSELNPDGEWPERTFTKPELLTYLEYCRKKCRAKITALTEGTAHQHCGFQRCDFTVVELLLYNMRHVQHHAGQLNLILRQKTDSAPTWVHKAGD